MKSLYNFLRRLTPKKLHKHFTKFLFQFNIKPTYNKKETSPFKKGIIVFSADFEMAWAFRYSKTLKDKAVETGILERENMPKLLEFFEKYNLPVTWATVGHLFLDGCNDKHVDMPRPNYFKNRNWEYNAGDWYDHDPCTDHKKALAWYAPDLIRKILGSKVKHEIGCHTFSHIDCTYTNCSEELMDRELKKSKELAQNLSVSMKSFVFPGGTFGNYETLKKNGFTCYRKPKKYHIDIPEIDEFGLVSIPSSHMLDKDPYGWSKEFHYKIINNFIKKTIRSKQVCHLWFHPSMDPGYMNNILPEILNNISEHRKRGDIDVMTMGELTNLMLKNA